MLVIVPLLVFFFLLPSSFIIQFSFHCYFSIFSFSACFHSFLILIHFLHLFYFFSISLVLISSSYLPCFYLLSPFFFVYLSFSSYSFLPPYPLPHSFSSSYSVQNSQCREIRTETSAAMHMDTIIIAASAAICGTVIIAVVVFICCNRKRGGVSKEKHGIPSVLSASSPPLASLGTLGTGLGGGGGKPDWDTLSMYSQRSIPRARMYHMDKGDQMQVYVCMLF